MACASLPPSAGPAVRALQQHCRGSLPGLADAVAATSSAASPAAFQCSPWTLAAAVAVTVDAIQLWGEGCGDRLQGAITRLLAVLLQQSDALTAEGTEHSTAGGGAEPVGAVLCRHLVALFAAEDQACSADAALAAALGGLLTYSHSAKAAALDAGLHRRLLDSRRSLAAEHSAPAARPLSSPRPASRTGRLRQLKQRRGGKLGAAALAFGSRAPSREGSRHPAPTAAAASVDAAPVATPGSAADAAHKEARLRLCLRLLEQLAFDSPSSGDSLAEAGAVGMASALWSGGASGGVQDALLRFLATLLASSPAARKALAETGKQGRDLQLHATGRSCCQRCPG